jgi:hypothetical protein
MATKKTTEQLEAIERLRGWIKPGDTIYCILRNVSRTGMSRVIDLKHIDCTDAERPMSHIGYNAALAMGMSYDRKREGIKIGGAGMDMGFALVYDLAWTLWPEGAPCTGDKCPSNDHTNDRSSPRGEGVTHKDAGYALKHSWL